MDKLKKIFKKDKANSSAGSSPPAQSQQQPAGNTTTSTAPAQTEASTSGALPNGVLLETNYGNITVALFSEQTPKTCKNFATLADRGEYNNVIFHRIIPGFMLQGGDPTGTGRGGFSIYPGGKFEDEIVPSLRHTRAGILSMANSGPGTNGSQFFITLAPTPHLDGKHTVFGQVVDGMDVVEKIGNVKTGPGDRPLKDVVITKAQSFRT